MRHIGSKRQFFFNHALLDAQKTTATIKVGDKPVRREKVMTFEEVWESYRISYPTFFYDEDIKKYRMYYCASHRIHEESLNAKEMDEPDMRFCYAESEDGIHWKKSRINPIFVKDKNNFYEKDRVGGCQVIKTEDMGYVMFYIGYEDIHTARICAARSADGITRWERCPLNPLIQPTGEGWDADATYKPSFLWDEENCRWMLWYNGRAARVEAIGLATKAGRELF
jgi:hypothetical protein